MRECDREIGTGEGMGPRDRNACGKATAGAGPDGARPQTAIPAEAQRRAGTYSLVNLPQVFAFPTILMPLPSE